MSKKGKRNGSSVSLKSHGKSCSEESQKILFWWMRSPRTSSTKSSASYCKRKFQFWEDYFWMSTTWRSKIWSEEIHKESYARGCREIEKLKWRCCQEETTEKTTKIGSNFLRSMIRNHEQWESILLRPWLTEQLWRTYVPHQALITSSSIGKPSREIGMPRNTRENMSIPGNVFDCQQARRDPEELHNDSRNLTTPSGIDDDVEDSEKRRNWEQWERRVIAINTFTLLFSKSEEKKSWRQNKSHVYD